MLGDFLNGLPGGMRAAFEFRHESWFDDEVFETLRTCGAALCIADTEKLETPKVVTTNYGYLRLRREDYSGERCRALDEVCSRTRIKLGRSFCFFQTRRSRDRPEAGIANEEIAELGEQQTSSAERLRSNTGLGA